MKQLIIRSDSAQAVNDAVRALKKSLKKGDIILSGPVPKNPTTRFFNIILMVTIRIMRGITHSCVYLGDGQILDIDYKILKPGTEIDIVNIKTFVEGKIAHFGGSTIYVVTPRHYTKKNRQLVVDESVNNFIKNKDKLSHTLIGSILLGIRYRFFKNKNYKEDLSFRNSWTCSEMVAYILKKSGTHIGRRASYTFAPPMFIFNRNFRVKRKLILK